MSRRNTRLIDESEWCKKPRVCLGLLLFSQTKDSLRRAQTLLPNARQINALDAPNALPERLERLRPLSAEQIEMLFPRWRAEDALFVYASNAIEGSTLTLGETIAVLRDGITIGGKSLRDHVDAVNGSPADELMLSLARGKQSVSLDNILDRHRAVVGTAPFAGRLRDHAVYIRGSRHVPRII